MTDGKIIAVDRFGASAPYKIVYEKFGITAEAVVSRRLGSAELIMINNRLAGSSLVIISASSNLSGMPV